MEEDLARQCERAKAAGLAKALCSIGEPTDVRERTLLNLSDVSVYDVRLNFFSQSRLYKKDVSHFEMIDILSYGEEHCDMERRTGLLGA